MGWCPARPVLNCRNGKAASHFSIRLSCPAHSRSRLARVDRIERRSNGEIGHRSHRINEKICSLQERRPANVTAEAWSDCVAWASIAHCNICFSEEHTSYEAMCRFEEQLDDQLRGEVDLNTFAWIGDR